MKTRILIFFSSIALLSSCISSVPTLPLLDGDKSDESSTPFRTVGDEQVRGVRREQPTPTQGEATGKRYALVIGNADYTDPNISRLSNPVNDASDMRTALRKVGFDVIYVANAANKREMEQAVQNFTARLENGGIGLFYYAGHGVQVNGENYLIPTQVTLPSQTEVKYNTMSAQYVLDKMEKAGNGFNMIFLDACRDNPLLPDENTRSIEKGKSGLAEMRNPTGSIIVFSTSPNNKAEDGKGRNGTFTKYLKDAIQRPGLSLNDMLMEVRQNVMAETNSRQVPWENSSLVGGKFCFAGCEDPQAELAKKRAEEAERRLREAERRLEHEKQRAEEAERRAESRQDARINEESRKLREEADKARREAYEAKIEAERAKEQAAEEMRKQDSSQGAGDIIVVF